MSAIDNLKFLYDNGHVPVTLLSSDAEAVVKEIKNERATSSQMRKMFHSFLAIKAAIDIKTNESERNDEFRIQLPYIRMLYARQMYNRARSKTDRDREGTAKDAVVRLVAKCVNHLEGSDIAKERKAFELACDFLESVIAYSTVYLNKN